LRARFAVSNPKMSVVPKGSRKQGDLRSLPEVLSSDLVGQAEASPTSTATFVFDAPSSRLFSFSPETTGGVFAFGAAEEMSKLVAESLSFKLVEKFDAVVEERPHSGQSAVFMEPGPLLFNVFKYLDGHAFFRTGSICAATRNLTLLDDHFLQDLCDVHHVSSRLSSHHLGSWDIDNQMLSSLPSLSWAHTWATVVHSDVQATPFLPGDQFCCPEQMWCGDTCRFFTPAFRELIEPKVLLALASAREAMTSANAPVVAATVTFRGKTLLVAAPFRTGTGSDSRVSFGRLLKIRCVCDHFAYPKTRIAMSSLPKDTHCEHCYDLNGPVDVANLRTLSCIVCTGAGGDLDCLNRNDLAGYIASNAPPNGLHSSRKASQQKKLALKGRRL
jgi:hypothetical protein